MKKDLLIFKIIGQMSAEINKAKSFKDAVQYCLRLLVDNKIADYIVNWYHEDENSDSLVPLYWICPFDLSTKTCSVSNSDDIVGKTFKENCTQKIIDYQKYPNQITSKNYPELNIRSLVCVPLNSGNFRLGVIEFIRTNSAFENDDVDVLEIISMLIQTLLKEYNLLPSKKEKKNVLISVKDIEKTFKSGDQDIKVLNKMNFDVLEGEFLCFLGESGCGKSTMLNILGGLLNFDEGSLKFRGVELKDASRDELTEYRMKNIGFIFQSYNLMPNLNAVDNLNLIAELVSNPADSLEMLDLVGLKNKAKSFPAELSGGQQQRIAIARALVKRPTFILADEPTAALDYKTSIEILEVLERIVKSGTTIIMVTHNVEISKMANRIIKMKNGKMHEVIVNSHPLKASELVW